MKNRCNALGDIAMKIMPITRGFLRDAQERRQLNRLALALLAGISLLCSTALAQQYPGAGGYQSPYEQYPNRQGQYPQDPNPQDQYPQNPNRQGQYPQDPNPQGVYGGYGGPYPGGNYGGGHTGAEAPGTLGIIAGGATIVGAQGINSYPFREMYFSAKPAGSGG
jgi:hypothetical protein